jgi:hypothetical protein
MRIHVRLWWSVHSSSGGLVGRTRIRLVLLFFLSFFFFFSFLDIFDVTSPNRHASDGYGTVADWQSRLVAWSVQFVPTARATFGFGIGHHLLGCDDTRSWIFVSWNENDFSVPPLDSQEKEKKRKENVVCFDFWDQEMDGTGSCAARECLRFLLISTCEQIRDRWGQRERVNKHTRTPRRAIYTAKAIGK